MLAGVGAWEGVVEVEGAVEVGGGCGLGGLMAVATRGLRIHDCNFYLGKRILAKFDNLNGINATCNRDEG